MTISTAPRQSAPSPDDPWREDENAARHLPGAQAAAQPAKPTPHFLAQLAHNQNAVRAKATCAARAHDRRSASLAPRSVRSDPDNEWMRKQLRDDEAFMPPPWCEEAYTVNERAKRSLPPGLVATALALIGGAGFGILAWYTQDDETRATIAAGTMPALAEMHTPEAPETPATSNAVPAAASEKPIESRIAATPETSGLRAAREVKAEADIVSQTASIAPMADDAKPAGKQAAPVKTPPANTVLSQANLEIARHYRLRADENMLIGNIVSARALYFKAFQLGDPGAAYQLGRSYDPAVLEAMNVVGPKADVKLASDWYRQAKQAGYVHAGQQSRTIAQDANQVPNAN